MRDSDEDMEMRVKRLEREDVITRRARAIVRHKNELQNKSLEGNLAPDPLENWKLQESRKRRHTERHQYEQRAVEKLALQAARERDLYRETHQQMEIVEQVAREKPKHKKSVEEEDKARKSVQKQEEVCVEDIEDSKKGAGKKGKQKSKKKTKQKEKIAEELVLKKDDEQVQKDGLVEESSPTIELAENEDVALVHWFQAELQRKKKARETSERELLHRELQTEYQKWTKSYDAYCRLYYDTYSEVSYEIFSSTTTSASDEDEYPLTHQSKKRKNYATREEAAWKRSEAQKNLEIRMNTLTALKNKMEDMRRTFLCHREERQRLQEVRASRFLKSHLSIDVQNLPAGSNVMNLFRQHQREKRERHQQQNGRYMVIIKRLLNEEKRKHSVFRSRKPNLHYEKKRVQARKIQQIQEREVAILEIMTTDSKAEESAWETEEEDNLPGNENQEKVEGNEKEAEIPVKQHRGKGDDKTKIGKKGKKDEDIKGKVTSKVKRSGNGEKTSSKKEKGKKTGKKDKKEKNKKGANEANIKTRENYEKSKETEYIPLPEPVRRSRVEPENILVPELIESFLLADTLEVRAPPPTPEPPDPEIVWKPDCFLFKDFSPGLRYRRKLRITNVGPKSVRCRLVRIEHSEGDDPQVLQVELLDTCTVKTGLSFSVFVVFRPTEKTLDVIGRVVLITCRFGSTNRELYIPVHCVPSRPEPAVVPTNLRFPTMQGWSGNLVQYGYLEVVNTGGRPCSFSINKVLQPNEENILSVAENSPTSLTRMEYQVDTVSPSANDKKKKKDLKPEHEERALKMRAELVELQPINVAIELLEECVQNVFEQFRFDQKYYVTVSARSCVHLQVHFEPHEPGFHLEKFLFKFDSFCPQVEVTVTGGTTVLPFQVAPSVLDFQMCCMDGGVCQQSFSVCSMTKILSVLNIHVPSALRKHVNVFPKSVFLRLGEEQRIFVKLAPSSSLCVDAPEFYNISTEVLEFPVYVQPKGMVFHGCVPLQLLVLAVVTSPHALTLLPAAIDFGTVTTVETVVCPLQLTNNSQAIHKFGFLNLPKDVSVQPSDGFGTIFPEETLSLQLFYSPTIRDKPCHKFAVHCSTLEGTGQVAPDADMENIKVPVSVEQPKLADDAKDIELSKKSEDTFHVANMELLSTVSEPESLGSKRNLNNFQVSESKSLEVPVASQQIESVIDKEDHEFVANLKSVESVKIPTESVGEMKREELSVIDHKSESKFSEVSKVAESGGDNRELKTISTSEDKEGSTDVQHLEHIPQILQDNRVLKNMVHCVAHVIEPACQLSCNSIQFPPTPCGTFSLVSTRLRAKSVQSCCCSLQQSCEAATLIRFEFKSQCDQITIAPHAGVIASGQEMKVTLVFQPQLKEQDIHHEARVLKANRILQEKRDQQAIKLETARSESDTTSKKQQGKEKKNKSNKGKSRKGKETDNFTKKSKSSSKKTGRKDKKEAKSSGSAKKKQNLVLEQVIDPDSLEVEPGDMFPAEKSLLEALEPYCLITTVSCLLQADNGNACPPHVLNLALTCPVVRPDFLIRWPSQCLNFGPVAVGLRLSQTLRVQNIGSRSVKISTSLLNPVGPFSCPPMQPWRQGGPYLDPEHILNLPISFTPQEDTNEVKEYMEVRGGRTVFTLMLSGVGVAPQFSFNPDFLLYKFEGKSSDCTIEIRNTCTAPLQFHIQHTFFGVANVSQVLSEINKEKTENKGKKENNMNMKISPEDKCALERDFSPTDGLETLFSLVGLSENNDLIVVPFQKGDFKVQYTIPGDVKKMEKKQKKTKKKEISSQEEKDNDFFSKKYAVKYNVTLGGMVEVRELIFIATPSSNKKDKAGNKKGGKKSGSKGK